MNAVLASSDVPGTRKSSVPIPLYLPAQETRTIPVAAGPRLTVTKSFSLTACFQACANALAPLVLNVSSTGSFVPCAIE